MRDEMPVVKKVNLVVHGGREQFNAPFTLSDTVSDLKIFSFSILRGFGLNVTLHC